VVLQLEIPLDTVHHAVAIAKRHGVFIILDPAPVPPKGLPRELMDVDVLTPNQGEAEMLLGWQRTHHVSVKKLADPKLIAMDLLSRGPRAVVLKLGRNGALLVTKDEGIVQIEPHKVDVSDTTAAGDAFTGALAVARAEGLPLRDAVRFANAAGAACCKQFGAQPALPTREAVERLLGP
jgi:ribokinase